MGPVNLKNPNFSFSVRFTVKNTILDRTFTRLSKFQLPDWESSLDLWTILDSEFSFLRRENSYFQFHRMPILMRYPITLWLCAVAGFCPTWTYSLCWLQFSFFIIIYPTSCKVIFNVIIIWSEILYCLQFAIYIFQN